MDIERKVKKPAFANAGSFRSMEDRRNDWLARQLREEAIIKEKESAMYHLKRSHEANSDAGRLKREHYDNCDARQLRREHHDSCDAREAAEVIRSARAA